MKYVLLLVAAYVAMGEGQRKYTRTPLGDSVDKSSMRVLKEAYSLADDKNVVSSPLGLMLLLSLYNTGAGAGSRTELNQFLGGSNFQELNNKYTDLSNTLAQIDPSYLTLANKVYMGKQYTPTFQFAAEASWYNSEVESIDFTNTAEAARIINKWAEEKTRGNIKNTLDKDTLANDTLVALFNVIFFRGHWHVPFQVEQTQEKDFNIDATTKVKKPMMHLLRSLSYTENAELDAKMIELPYKEDGFRMVVVLPNKVDGLSSVLTKAAETGLLSDVFRLSPITASVDLDLPKFEVRSKIDFNQILPKLGVSKIFNEAAHGIVKDWKVKVSKAFQEAFIQVDEEGATAGAFSGLLSHPISADWVPFKPLVFKVDHPFLYIILREDKILFAGTYTH